MLDNAITQIDLDIVSADHIKEVLEDSSRIALLSLSVENWEIMIKAICILRSMNIAPLVVLKELTDRLEHEELYLAFTSLKNIDQLTLHNFLMLSKTIIPTSYITSIEREARLEKKWLTEWLLANTDSNVNYYPILPWRSYIRKTINENYRFTLEFLETINSSDQETLEQLLNQFLIEKQKKVLCVFPKNWMASSNFMAKTNS